MGNNMKDTLIDPGVYSLAALWLDRDPQVSEGAHELRVISLASVIQRVIEDWMCEDALRNG